MSEHYLMFFNFFSIGLKTCKSLALLVSFGWGTLFISFSPFICTYFVCVCVIYSISIHWLIIMIQAFGSWTLFWDIYKLLWWFPLGFELLNPNPFGARLQMLSIFFYSPFFQDGRQILETCISWLVDVVESNEISRNVCSRYQGIYFFENNSL